MRNLQWVVWGLVLSALAACGNEADDFTPPRPLTPQEQALVTSSNEFGFGFFSEVAGQSGDENVFVSPLSVSMALGMTYNGARTTTAEGMATALSFGEMSLDEVNQTYRSLIDLLVDMDPLVTMEIANSVWYRQGLDVLQSFIDACAGFFDAAVQALDFADPESISTINAWVAEKTHDKIDRIVDDIDPLTMMFLINAIYFKGDWTSQMDPDQTRDDQFHAAGGQTRTVKMMHLDAEVGHFAGQTFTAVHLPYGHELFGMSILLPNEGQTVDDVVAELSSGSWAQWMSNMAESEQEVYLPRFELEYESTLNAVLQALGMTDAFDPYAADFSGITTQEALYISEVKHKTFVKVNEEGTEAAAVTSVEMRVTSAVMPFRVDRPFVFVIHDMHSQSLLFMGRIMDLPDA